MRVVWSSILLLASCVDAGSSSPSPAGDDDLDLRGAAASPTSRWPTSPIVYWIDASSSPGATHAKSSQKHCGDAVGAALSGASGSDLPSEIHKAVASYQAQTSLKYQELTHVPTVADGPVLVFTQGPAGSAAHSGGIPDGTSGDFEGCIFIPPASDATYSTFMHEMGHQMGRPHEQTRSDYCSAVTIDLQCVNDDKKKAFATRTSSQNLTPYDPESIMEYGSTGDCVKTLPGCSTTDPSTGKSVCAHPPILRKGCHDIFDPACLVGHGPDISADDVNSVYRMYEPSLGSNEAGDHLGMAMAVGDFDGDGYDDLAVGAPDESPFTGPKTGAVFLYKGTEGGLVAWKILTESDFASATLGSSDRFGLSVAAGDFDGDGLDDLLVGAPGYAGHGAAFLFKGHGTDGDRTWPKPWAMYDDRSTSTGNNSFGAAVAIHGNTLAIGAPNAAAHAHHNGMVFVHVHDGSWTSLTPDAGILSPVAGTGYGSALAFGNVRGLGNDLYVGAPASATVGPGAVYVYSSALAFAQTIVSAPHTTGDGFGAAIAIGHLGFSINDMLAVGAPGASTGGRVELWFSSPLMRGETYTQANIPGMANQAGDLFGSSLAIGDLDGDGFDDLVAGAPGNNARQGVVGLVHGGDLNGWTNRGERDDGFPIQGGDQFGTSIAIGRFGDVNDDPTTRNDTPADIAIGSPFRSPGNHAGAGGFQEFFGQNNAQPVFAHGFDQHSVQTIGTIPGGNVCTPIVAPPSDGGDD